MALPKPMDRTHEGSFDPHILFLFFKIKLVRFGTGEDFRDAWHTPAP